MAKLADATLSATGTVQQAEEALLVAHANAIGIDGSRLLEEIRRLPDAERVAASRCITSPFVWDARISAQRIKSSSEWLRDAFVRAGIYALEHHEPAAFASAINALDRARDRTYHAALVDLSKDFASDDEIASALGLDITAEQTARETMRARERIASEVADASERIAQRLGFKEPSRDSDGLRRSLLVAVDRNATKAQAIRSESHEDLRVFFLEDALVEEDGMLSWDAALVAELRAIGAGDVADRVADMSRARWSHRTELRWLDRLEPSPSVIWRAWQDPTDTGGPIGAPFLLPLTKAAWERIVRPALEKARDRHVPAFFAPVARTLAVAGAHTTRYERRTGKDGQLDLLLDRDDHVRATLAPVSAVGLSIAALEILRGDEAAQIIGKAFDALKTPEGHALAVEWLPELTRNIEEAPAPSYEVTIPGAYSAIAASMGFTDEESAKRIRNAFLALSLLSPVVERADQTPAFVSVQLHVPARGQRQSLLTFEIGHPYRKSFSDWLRDRIGNHEASFSRLSALVPLPGRTPLHGRGNDWGKQETAALELAIMLRERAPEAVERGGVEITRVDWELIADRAGYGRRGIGAAAEKLREGFLVASSTSRPAPPLLTTDDGKVFRYHSSRQRAWDALLAGGRITQGAVAGGLASKQRKRRRTGR